jgi:Putative Actinobacterial Holin-X, holin superfamily III
MDEPVPPLTTEAADADQAPGLVDELRQLAADGRTLLEAELAYQKSRAALAGRAVGSIAGWGALALALVFFALMALVMGLILALTPQLGPWGAMAAVVIGLLVSAALAGWIAAQRWKRTAAQLADKGETP